MPGGLNGKLVYSEPVTLMKINLEKKCNIIKDMTYNLRLLQIINIYQDVVLLGIYTQNSQT